MAMVVVAPIATPTPTPALDHFRCYDAKEAPKRRKFQKVDVDLRAQAPLIRNRFWGALEASALSGSPDATPDPRRKSVRIQ
jgi:hypothetical protein